MSVRLFSVRRIGCTQGALAVTLLFSPLSWACSCSSALSVCDQVKGSDVVFIGTVQAILPEALNRWNSSQRSTFSLRNPEIARWASDSSPQALIGLKQAYLKALPDLPKEDQRRLQAVSTRKELDTFLDALITHGRKNIFQVRTMVKAGDDDDDADASKSTQDAEKKKSLKKDDDDGQNGLLAVSTEIGGCGYEFQEGETYVVYASKEEAGGELSVTTCSRTARLSDAGDDLAYLFFYEKGASASRRLEGFVTSDLKQLNRDRFHYSGKTDSPVSDVVIEVASRTSTRFARPNSGGQFLIDGLEDGVYTLTVFSSAYPARQEQVAAPRSIVVNSKECATLTVLVLGP